MEERLKELLKLAVKYGSQTICFNQQYSEMNITIRIDGDLKKVKQKYGDQHLIRYLMYLSDMDVGNRLIPQTNSFNFLLEGKELNLRFAVIESPEHTNGVLRILGGNSNA